MSGLPERHPVQRVGPPARRQGVDHEVRERADWPVEGLRSFDALSECHRLDGAERGPRCP
jgi:hypothetical protein